MSKQLEEARKAQMIANLPWEKKKAKDKAKREAKRNRWFNSFWKSEARKVCEERLAHYESTGNQNKANIYRLKLGKKTLVTNGISKGGSGT